MIVLVSCKHSSTIIIRSRKPDLLLETFLTFSFLLLIFLNLPGYIVSTFKFNLANVGAASL